MAVDKIAPGTQSRNTQLIPHASLSSLSYVMERVLTGRSTSKRRVYYEKINVFALFPTALILSRPLGIPAWPRGAVSRTARAADDFSTREQCGNSLAPDR